MWPRRSWVQVPSTTPVLIFRPVQTSDRAFLLPRKTPCTNGICKIYSDDTFSPGEFSARNPGPIFHEKTPKFSGITGKSPSIGECIAPKAYRRQVALIYAAGERRPPALSILYNVLIISAVWKVSGKSFFRVSRDCAAAENNKIL